MKKRIHFFKTITKSLTAKDSDRRLFEGLLTVEMVDKQNEITIVDELIKALPIWIARGAPISDTHSNRIVGHGINFEKTTVDDGDNVYPAILIQGEIFKDYELDDEIWEKIKDGTYKGLSFGGATKADRHPIRNKDGTISYALSDLEHYEVAVCEDPAVPLALILDYNQVAKANIKREQYTIKNDHEVCIKCDKIGCYIDKWYDTKYTDKDPSRVSDDPQGEENSSVGGKNKPYPLVENPPAFKGKKTKKPEKITAGNQNDILGEDPTIHSTGQPSSITPSGGGFEGGLTSNLKSNLEKMIDYWRKSNEPYAEYYVDAIQSVYKNEFNETLKFHDDEDKEKQREPTGVGSTTYNKPVGGSGCGDINEDPVDYGGEENRTMKISGYELSKEEVETEFNKTINTGENLVMEKPIRGIRGTGGERSFDPIEGKAVNGPGDYCMNGILDDDENDPRNTVKGCAGTFTTVISAVNGENGKSGTMTVYNDEEAEGLKEDEKKALIFATGIKGSTDTFEQGSGDSRQISNRKHDEKEILHGRDTIQTSLGHDDGYSLGKSIEIAAEILKLKSKLLTLKSIE